MRSWERSWRRNWMTRGNTKFCQMGVGFQISSTTLKHHWYWRSISSRTITIFPNKHWCMTYLKEFINHTYCCRRVTAYTYTVTWSLIYANKKGIQERKTLCDCHVQVHLLTIFSLHHCRRQNWSYISLSVIYFHSSSCSPSEPHTFIPSSTFSSFLQRWKLYIS